jgi:hypothetical protein
MTVLLYAVAAGSFVWILLDRKLNLLRKIAVAILIAAQIFLGTFRQHHIGPLPAWPVVLWTLLLAASFFVALIGRRQKNPVQQAQ